jgi:hypothetical protein
MDTDGTSALAIPAEARLYGKMAKVMGIVNRVPKSGTNTFHNYRYASADDVADTIRGAMSEVNLALIVRMGEVKQETVEYQSSSKTTRTMRTTINFNFIFACGDTGAVISAPWTSQVDDNSDKAINKCATSAEKYFLMKTFIVSAGDEPDADADKHTPEVPRKVTPKWYEEERNLHELSERAFTSAYIKERNGKGIEDLKTLISPRVWDDFATGKDCWIAIKEAAEARQAAMQPAPEPTAVPDQSPDAMPEVADKPAHDYPFSSVDEERRALAKIAAESDGAPVVTAANKPFNPSAAHQHQKPLEMRVLNSTERKAAERDLEA